MKVTSFALLAFFGVAAANRPQLSIQVRDGNFDGLEGLDPVISWEGSSESGDIDLSFGADLSPRPSSDLESAARSIFGMSAQTLSGTIWGKASKTVSGWGTSVRAEVDAQDLNSANIEVEGENEENDLSVKIFGTAGKELSVSNVEATKGFDAENGRVTVNPRYNLETKEGDVVIGYNTGDTQVEITASKGAQSVTVSQQVDDDNRVAPTIDNDGNISVEWERSLGDGKSITTTLKPNESIDVEWKDDAWTANINMPIDGTDIQGANVSVKREVNF